MKVLAINGSPHVDGNTAFAIKLVTEELNRQGIETEIMNIGNKPIRGCIACGYCRKEKNEKCVFDDEVNEAFSKIKDADGIILGSPVHYAGITGAMKSFLDRLLQVNGNNGNPLRHKVGVAVSAVRRSGGIQAVDQMNKYLEFAEMIIPTSNYWNVTHGCISDDAGKDEEGNQIMQVLGQNMAWTLKTLAAGKNTVKELPREKKVLMNFIR